MSDDKLELDTAGRLIVALDVPSAQEARDIVDTLDGTVRFYKIGLELVLSGGLGLIADLTADGAHVFLDMKLLDIGHTVERAVAAAARSGATFLTIHATDKKTLSAANAGRAGTGLKLLGVTVMTNLDANDLGEQGITQAPHDLVLHRAALARACGIDGVIASGNEAPAIRTHLGPELTIVAPGIRRANDAIGDQSRVMTPAAALSAGADYLVVGRPITAASDPKAAASAIIAEMVAATA